MSAKAKTSDEILGMSDEEFAKLPVPPEDPKPAAAAPAEPAKKDDEEKPEEEPAASAAADEPEPEEPTAEEEPAEPAEPEPEEPKADDPPAVDPKADPEPAAAAPTEEPPAAAAEPGDPPKAPAKPDDAKADKKKLQGAEITEVDYEAFYKQVMAPFKANGKLIQLQSPDEVVQLMQMGANYTKKMQSIQQHKKFLMMLENNGLLDENQISFYIDLHKKDPEAIKKFLKDAKVDPVDLDLSGEIKYRGGSHAVTDQEANLASAIEELNSTPTGKETLQSVQAWDQASKKVLWDNPELLSVIHSQRENGIYARISAEIERRRVLGQVGPNVPFMQAYRVVGDELQAQGAFKDLAPKTTATPRSAQPVAPRTPVAVRPAKTPATKADDKRVKAAAATRSSTPAKAATPVNVLAMSDDEFLKQFANKV